MKKLIILIIMFSLCFLYLSANENETEDSVFNSSVDLDNGDNGPSLVYILDISGGIGTVTADRVIEAVELAEDDYADLLLIIMDTPGGLMISEWDITKAIMNSEVPVAVYVYPVGANSGSAGVFISYSAHISAMAPNSRIGAAHSVMATGGQMDSVMSDKVQNDAVASIKAMANRYGRNAEWAESAVRESASITSDEALELNVIDLIAEDIDDLLEKVDSREVKTGEGTIIINTDKPVKKNLEKSLIHEILDILVNPNVVFALLALGGLGIMMEIYNPGSIFPGVIGVISIIIAGYGIRILPISTAGILLLIMALILFILEVKIVSHGLLTIGGVISLVLGGLMLVDSPDPYLQVSISVIIAVAIVIGGFAAFSIFYIIKARRSKPTTGGEGLIGEIGIVKTKIDQNGYIQLAGELWKATADEIIDIDEEVEVLEVNNLRVKVKRKL